MSRADRSVVLLGDYDYDYPREKLLRQGLELAGATVYECRFRDEPLFVGVRKLLLLPLFYLRVIRRMAEIRDETGGVDAVVLTKFNPLLIPLAAYYARRLDCPLVYDLFVSLYRTAEMRDVAWPLVKAVFALEWITLRLPDHLLVGTNQFVDLYSEMYGLSRERFVRLPPGVDEEWFHRIDAEKPETFTALYWGNFLPHHGVDTILGAAAECRNLDVEFVFLGEGPELDRSRRIADDLGLGNVRFEGRVPMADLQRSIGEAHVALGVFSSDRRAMASITNKVSEGVAMGKAVVTERSPAIEEWFEHGESVYLVPPEDSQALAAAIRELAADPEQIARLEEGAHEVYRTNFTKEEIGRILGDVLF